MNWVRNIRSTQVIRFKRWSNKSFAIFNSLRKVIQIGFLSKIIHGLSTASTERNSIKMVEQLDQSTEFSGEEWLDLDVLQTMELLGLEPVVELASKNSSVAVRLSLPNFQNHIYIYLRPFWGLLFYQGLDSSGNPGLFYSNLN